MKIHNFKGELTIEYQFRNLVFEGGGVTGIAYLGAMEVLKSKGILKDIKRVGGTSAGAINALLVGLNFSPAETKKFWASLILITFWMMIGESSEMLTGS